MRSPREGEFTYADRTDDVRTKVWLLEVAQRAGNYALALALADSIKDTLRNERMLGENPGTPVLPASGWRPVEELPAPWARWASGWARYQGLALTEPIGQARQAEPVDLVVGLPVEGVTWPARELRVARLDTADGRLWEVRSQVYGEVRRGREWLVHLVLEADAPACGRAVYLAFCGNPAAELPGYPSELRVGGEGVGLQVETPFYIAALSHQSGQMERLTAKWHSGFLELYINAYAHGEPPNIDWAHDYLASEYFQKFRVTSWDACPNADVVRGPLCTIVRRFGFPAGPTHPLFTPSRLLMDLSYTFYATAPYFLKDGRMEAAQDFTLNYARDDEWLFAGRPFTDALWMDEGGRVHEGPVPLEHAERVWGQGFFNRDGRESMFAIYLAHRVEAPADADAQATAGVTLHHEGSMQLDYSYTAGGLSGHNQIWNRAHLRNPRFTAGVAVVQRNAYLFAPYPAGTGAGQLEGLRQRLLQPLLPSAADGLAGAVAAAGGDGGDGLARRGERPVDWDRKRAIWEALRTVPDEEFYKVDANVVDMGYVYDVRLRGEDVYVLMTMPRKGRPKYNFLANPMRARVGKLEGVRSVVVDLTWEPAWTPNRLSDAGRQAMGLDG